MNEMNEKECNGADTPAGGPDGMAENARTMKIRKLLWYGIIDAQVRLQYKNKRREGIPRISYQKCHVKSASCLAKSTNYYRGRGGGCYAILTGLYMRITVEKHTRPGGTHQWHMHVYKMLNANFTPTDIHRHQQTPTRHTDTQTQNAMYCQVRGGIDYTQENKC